MLINNNCLSRFYIFFLKVFFFLTILRKTFLSDQCGVLPNLFHRNLFERRTRKKIAAAVFRRHQTLSMYLVETIFFEAIVERIEFGLRPFAKRIEWERSISDFAEIPNSGTGSGPASIQATKQIFFLISNSCFGNFWTLCSFVYFKSLNMHNFKC